MIMLDHEVEVEVQSEEAACTGRGPGIRTTAEFKPPPDHPEVDASLTPVQEVAATVSVPTVKVRLVQSVKLP